MLCFDGCIGTEAKRRRKWFILMRHWSTCSGCSVNKSLVRMLAGCPWCQALSTTAQCTFCAGDLLRLRLGVGDCCVCLGWIGLEFNTEFIHTIFMMVGREKGRGSQGSQAVWGVGVGGGGGWEGGSEIQEGVLYSNLHSLVLFKWSSGATCVVVLLSFFQNVNPHAHPVRVGLMYKFLNG